MSAFRIFLNPPFRHPHTDPVYDFLDLLLRINFRPSVNLRSDFISDQNHLNNVGLLLLWHTVNWNALKTGRNLPQNFTHTLHPPTTPTITNLNVYFRQFFRHIGYLRRRVVTAHLFLFYHAFILFALSSSSTHTY